jgi:hypothetical protein
MIKRIPCPNPSRHGCGCPRYSARCYGNIRAVREAFNAELAKPGPTQGDRVSAAERTLQSCPPEWGWSVTEILSRV